MEPPGPSVRPVSVNRKVYGRRSTLFPACLGMGWPEPNGFEIVEVTGGALIVLEGHGLNACGFIRVVTCFFPTMCWCFKSGCSGQQHGVLHSISRCCALKTLSDCQVVSCRDDPIGKPGQRGDPTRSQRIDVSQ